MQQHCTCRTWGEANPQLAEGERGMEGWQGGRWLCLRWAGRARTQHLSIVYGAILSCIDDCSSSFACCVWSEATPFHSMMARVMATPFHSMMPICLKILEHAMASQDALFAASCTTYLQQVPRFYHHATQGHDEQPARVHQCKNQCPKHPAESAPNSGKMILLHCISETW